MHALIQTWSWRIGMRSGVDVIGMRHVSPEGATRVHFVFKQVELAKCFFSPLFVLVFFHQQNGDVHM